MVRVFFLASLCFFQFCMHAKAEVRSDQISKETYEAGLNYANCVYIKLALRQSKVNGLITRFTEKCDCDDDFDQLNFDSIDDLLKDIYSGKNQKDYRKVQSFMRKVNASKQKIGESVEISEAIASLTDTLLLIGEGGNYLSKTPVVNEAIVSVGEKLNTFFKKNKIEVDSISEESNDIGDNSDIPLEDKEESSVITPLYFIVLIIVASLVSLLVALYLSKKQAVRELDKVEKKLNKKISILLSKLEKSSLNSHTNTELSNDNQNSWSELYSSLEVMKGSVESMEKEIERLKKVGDFKNAENKTKTNSQPTGKSKNNDPIQNQIFYASAPVNGAFLDSFSTTEYLKGRSIYRFSKGSGSTAEFQIADEPAAISKALNIPNVIVEPVSQPKNQVKGHHRKIKTISPGKAELRGGKWVVTEKAVIEYV